MNRREMIDELRQDLGLALRLFRRSRAFFAAAVLTLAIGIGANGAVFSILQSALLQPLPYRNPAELVMLWRTYPNRAATPAGTRRQVDRRALTSPMVLSWRRELSGQLGDVAALLAKGNLGAQFDVTLGDRAARLNGAFVTPNFFELLGVRAARGRVFNDADEASAEPLVLLSDALWQREFGGDPAIIGRPLALTLGQPRARRTFTVAGILPRGFHYTYPDEVEAWALMRWSDVERYEPGAIGFTAVARLRPGVALTQARRRAAELRAGLERPNERPEDRAVLGLEPMQDWVVGETRPSLQLLGGVAALLLLITCVTVANGLLARVSERQQELSVRVALGAGRSRLVRQLLTEGALLSVAGALAGTALAVALQPMLRALLPASVPRVGEITISAYVLAFGAAMAAVTTVLAAIAPAWGGTRFDAAATLTRASSSASATRSTVRWRQGLVGAQAAIATALLISAALLLTSFWQLGQVPLGFDGDKVLTVEMRLLDARYRQPGATARFQNDLMARVRAIPGIAEAGLTSAVPFRGVDFTLNVGRPGVEQGQSVNGRFVDSGYFSVLRIPLVRGRFFGSADREGERPVVLISESFARKVFGDEDPIGKEIQYTRAMEIIGVVGDLRYAGLENDPNPAIYLPRTQEPSALMCVVARTTAAAGTGVVAPAIRRAIRELDPALPAMNFTTIDRIIDASVANRRFYTVATAAFATIALLLTVVGLVVVVARVVTERRRELAIRAALGATMSNLARVATRDALLAVCLGVVTGLAGAFAGSVLLAQFLFHVAARSPTTYSLVAALVLSVAMLAAWGPVRRFDRTSLVGMLKAE